jgi:hypothetical protein
VSPPSPFDGVTLDGYARMRGVTLALPVPTVGRMLPAQLALAPQDLTPEGTHPVTLLYYDVIDARMSFASPLPPLTYREHIVAIPHTLATCGDPRCDGHGPLVYMPTLRLDNVFAVNGGVALWGFAKRLADIVESANWYDVHDRDGGRITSLQYTPRGGYRAPEAFPHFAKLREALDQPVVSRFPLARGPYVAASRFERRWRDAGVRALTGVVHVEREYVPGLAPLSHPMVGLDVSPMGGFEIAAHWRLGLPFPVTRL